MKKRFVEAEVLSEEPIVALSRAIAVLDTIEEVQAFLRDLCTPAELEALSDRWRVVPYLLDGVAYREIHDRTSVSVTTIGRVSRFLSDGSDGYQTAIRKLKRRKQWPETTDDGSSS